MNLQDTLITIACTVLGLKATQYFAKRYGVRQERVTWDRIADTA